jgi:DinB superfamily
VNPYATQLGERDPHQVIAETPARLEELAGTLQADGLKRALGPGKWTAREILCHLADTEIAFAFRLRQALAEPHHTIQPFDQDAWSRSYTALEARAALETFSALRRWNVGLINSVPKDAYTKPVSHPERGTMTFRTLVETMAGHDLNHLRQLEALAAQNS